MYQTTPLPSSQPAALAIYMVASEDDAKRWPVPPNSSVFLMDSNQSKFYIKSVDSIGIVSAFRIFQFKEELPEKIQNGGDFVTRDEFHSLEDKIDELLKRSTRKERSSAQSDSKSIQ